jgi:ribosomal protein S18 acetylase RimI-like enzyme
MIRVVPLSPEDARGAPFEDLLEAASGSKPDERAWEELRNLTLLGVLTDRVVAFAGFRDTDGRTILRYIAVAPHERGRGCGGALIDAIQERSVETELHAETDDDAVGFYRRLGFSVEPLQSDPRWPDHRRFRCIRRRGDRSPRRWPG